MKKHIRVGVRSAILEIESGGARGRGEASPLPGYSSESIAVAVRALRTATVPTLTDIDPLSQIRDAIAPLIETVPSAAFALETALLDLVATQQDRPPAALLGAEPGSSVFVNALVSNLDEVASARDRGIDTVKVKIGRRDFADELHLIADIRTHHGSAIAIRADANGAWTLEAAPTHLDALVQFDLEYLEEPCSATPWSFDAAIPLALDESLKTDAEGKISRARDSAVAVVVLKPASLGGVLRCMEIAAHAAANNMDTVITHMMGGPIELAACRAVALAIGTTRACGLDSHAGLKAWSGGALP